MYTDKLTQTNTPMGTHMHKNRQRHTNRYTHTHTNKVVFDLRLFQDYYQAGEKPINSKTHR